MLISKDFTFEASHILPNHPGKCRNLHGHSWILKVALEGPLNLKTGFVLDYNDLSAIVSPLIDVLDHTHLNWLVRYPSSELLNLAILHQLAGLLDLFSVMTLAIKETRKTQCIVRAQKGEDLSTSLYFPQEARLPSIVEAKKDLIVLPQDSVIQDRQALWLEACAMSEARILELKDRSLSSRRNP